MRNQLIFYLLLHLASKPRVISSGNVARVRELENRLMHQLFDNYHPEFLPRLDQSQPINVQFSFELINIKEVNAKNQFIAVYGWINQDWFNPLLQWNASEYGGIRHITVDATKVWVPDILLYNNYDVQDRVGGGKETYKTQISLTPEGMAKWKSPAIFNSLCDIDVTYFPFDVQACAMKFGSWSMNSAQLTITPQNMTNKSTSYVRNGEWELITTDWKRNVLQYADGSAYVDVTLIIEIGRNFHTYFANLVIPCAFISTMIFLSFLLPPECGERISLGITVLLAMTIFQQLTYQIFPSFAIPLLGQYYIATSLQIGLALVATTVILNFNFRKTTKMPGWLKKLLLCRLARLVRLKDAIEKSRPKPRRKCLRRRDNQRSSQCEERREDRLVQELKDVLHVPHQTFDYGATLYTANQAKAESLNPNETSGGSTTAASEQHDTREDAVELQTGVLDENGEELNEAELALRQWEWSMAASVLDRTILWLSVITGVVTLLGVFLQAPRVQGFIF